MNLRSGLLTGGLCLAGLLGGYAARKLAPNPAVHMGGDSAAKQNRGGEREGRLGTSGSGGPGIGRPQLPAFDDTLETLLNAPKDLSYRRVAHWLLDASAEEISTFWSATREDLAEDLQRLTLVHWMRLAPAEAMSATRDSEWEEAAWWARACLDPQGALAAWRNDGPWDHGKAIAIAIGECHPNWLRDHLTEIPEYFRDDAIWGFAQWSEGGDPRELLGFVAEQGVWGSDQMFRRMIRHDPWAALEWVRENEHRNVADTFGQFDLPFQGLVRFLKDADADALAEMAQQEPPGNRRRMMERALFERLVVTEPTLALQQARAVDSPAVAAERLLKVGEAIVEDDPETALDLLEESLSFVNDPFEDAFSVQTPDGSVEWPTSDPFGGPVHEMMGALLEEDPARVFLLQDSEEWKSVVASLWSFEDVDGFVTWLARTEEVERDSYSQSVVGSLRRDLRYRDAANWLLGMQDESKQEREFQSLIGDWSRVAPGNAREWVERAEVSAEEQAALESYLESGDE